MRFPTSGAALARLLSRLPALALLSALPAAAITDITFFATSDTHYGREFGHPYDSLRLATVDNLNALPGQHYPASVGGAREIRHVHGAVRDRERFDLPENTAAVRVFTSTGDASDGPHPTGCEPSHTPLFPVIPDKSSPCFIPYP